MFKLLNKRRKRGQSTLEYAILIIIIIGALMTIQVYIKRGVQGRLKSAADDIGDQYSPGNTNVITVTTVTSSTRERNIRGDSTSTMEEPELTTTVENSYIINTQSEFWGLAE